MVRRANRHALTVVRIEERPRDEGELFARHDLDGRGDRLAGQRITVPARPRGARFEQRVLQLSHRERVEIPVETAVARSVESDGDVVFDEGGLANLADRDCAKGSTRFLAHAIVARSAEGEVTFLERVGLA